MGKGNLLNHKCIQIAFTRGILHKKFKTDHFKHNREKDWIAKD